jgi:hypothetical protein
LGSGELQSIERLLTPAVVVTVVDAHSVDKVNRLLGLTGEMSVTPGNAAYLPIKHSAGACQIPKADGALDIAKLTELVTADTYILNAREPQISGTGQPSPLTVPLTEMPAEQVSAQPVHAAPTKSRAHLPMEPYLQIAIGQKVTATIEYLRITASGSPSFALLRLDNPDVSGILHYTQMSSSFRGLKGDRIEAWVRQVSPERREVVFTQAPVRLPGDDLVEAVDDRPFSAEGMVNFLMQSVSVDDILTAIEESFRVRGIDGEAPRANESLDRETIVDAYNRVIQNRGLLNTPLIPAPEYKKVISYGEVARTLGRPLSELIASAADMIGDYDVFQLGMAVLPAGFTPTEDSPFPAEHLDAFIAEFSKRAESAKITEVDHASLQPDCLSLASLSKAMGIAEAELLSLMAEKGIQPKVLVVLTTDEIMALKRHSDRD